MARWFANEAERVYSMFNESDNDCQNRQLVEWIERHGRSVTVRDVQRGHRQYKTSSDAEAALGELIKAGFGRWETNSHSGGNGRPVARFVLSISEASTASTVDTNGRNLEENGNCVSADSVDTPENTIPNPNDWGEI